MPVTEPGISCSIFATESGRETNSTAPCVPKVVVPASKDLIRVMNRVKALYRGWGIPCERSQFLRIPFPTHDGAHDQLPGQSTQITLANCTFICVRAFCIR
jgi:hypothetical protein